MTEKKQKELSLLYLNQAVKYLHLTENVFGEMLKQGNPWTVISNIPIDNYDDITKWSDFRIMLPSLFIFYHGIELSIKGLLIITTRDIKKIHNFLILFEELKKQKNINSEILDIIEKYTNKELLKNTLIGDWLIENNIEVNNLTERLRYPTGRASDETINRDLSLKYNGKKIIPFVEDLLLDIDKLRRLIVKQYYQI